MKLSVNAPSQRGGIGGGQRQIIIGERRQADHGVNDFDV